MAGVAAQSQVFAEKINVDQQRTPIQHVGMAIGAVVLGIVVIGIVNHHADR